jgi:alkanesulfonate monooxygenase SsuD/methylene tetrahydromethanopterin reductase-like flavin-dependent oxidoreductase (luciferase family)
MGLGALHKPLQRPHPPISVPSISRQSAGLRKAGERGFSLFSHHMIAPEVLADQWRCYADGAAAAGRQAAWSDWRVARNVFVADSTDEARRMARGNSLGQCIQYIIDLTRKGNALGMWKADPAMTDAAVNLDYFMERMIIAGDPDEVARQIRQLRRQVGPFGTLVLVAHDWDDRARWLRSLELFANDVAPQLN